MKKWCVIVILFLFLFVPFFAVAQNVPSKIKEVTLFSKQALVKREAFAQVQKGLNELLLEIQAYHIDRDSLSAAVFGDGEIFSVQFKEIPLKESPRKKILTLEEKIKKLKKSKRILSGKKEVLDKNNAFLCSLIDFAKIQVPREIKTSFPKIEDLTQTLAFLSSNFQKISAEKQSIDASIKETDKEIKVLKQELDALQIPDKKSKKVIEVLFNSEREQNIRIQATYLTRNASWTPLYKVAIPLTLTEADMTMFSNIRQKTGEDWEKVALSVSNVIPLKGVALPFISGWFLDVPRPGDKAMKKIDRLTYGHRGGIMAQALRDIPEQEAAFTVAQKKELPLSFEYKIPRMLNIESRDKETILPLFTKKLQGSFFYYAVPKTSPLTFLIFKTRADKELLSGPLNVYFADRYIGKTYLSEKKAGEEFNMSLGADRNLKVKREKIKDKIKETFLGKIERNTVIRELAYKITAENIKDKSVILRVIDSIPVSRTDKVQVKNIRITPEPGQKNYHDQEGVMLWEYNLQPREKQEINIEFVVAYPKDLPVNGL